MNYSFENGNYFEECEICGKKFCPMEDELDFEKNVSDRVTGASMYDYGIVCAECAEKKLFEWIEEEEIFIKTFIDSD